jgi:hypothetical protein
MVPTLKLFSKLNKTSYQNQSNVATCHIINLKKYFLKKSRFKNIIIKFSLKIKNSKKIIIKKLKLKYKNQRGGRTIPFWQGMVGATSHGQSGGG